MFVGRPNTVKTKKSLYKRWVVPYKKLTIQNKILKWQEANLAPRTIKSLISICQEIDKENYSKLTRIIMRSNQEVEIKALSKEEVIKLNNVITGRERLPILMALHTGMRRGEIWGLKWSDVNILKGLITVNNSYGGPTKNGKSRTIPISKALEEELLAYMPLKNYNDLRVIPTRFDPNPKLKYFCNLAGIKPISFHGLRHTFATLALNAGRSPKLVQETLGHSNVSTTLDIYWNSNEEKIDLGFIPNGRSM